MSKKIDKKEDNKIKNISVSEIEKIKNEDVPRSELIRNELSQRIEIIKIINNEGGLPSFVANTNKLQGKLEAYLEFENIKTDKEN